MKKTIKKFLNLIGAQLSRDVLRAEDEILAMAKLGNLWNEYLPWTSYAIKPSALVLLANEISIHKRYRVLEVGCGVSSVILSRMPGVSLTSIEHNPEWAEIVRSYIAEDAKSHIIDIPLVDSQLNGSDCKWYDESKILDLLSGEKFDLLLIDGPEGAINANSRLPALYKLSRYMDDQYTVVIDDTDRNEEASMVEEYVGAFNLTNPSYYRSQKVAFMRSRKEGPYFTIS